MIARASVSIGLVRALAGRQRAIGRARESWSRVSRVPAQPRAQEARLGLLAEQVAAASFDAIWKRVAPALDRIEAQEKRDREGRQDARAAQRFPELDGLLSGLAESTSQVNGEVGRVSDDLNRANAAESARTLGISIDRVAPSQAALDAFRREATALIKDIPDEQRRRIEALIAEAQSSGMRVETLRARIQQESGIARRRASLIARDQVLKANAKLHEDRQRAAGVTEYEWSTSLDERVRKRHRELEGKRFKWSDPPVTSKDGRRNHPGHDYQCRCTAIPIIGEDEDTDESALELAAPLGTRSVPEWAPPSVRRPQPIPAPQPRPRRAPAPRAQAAPPPPTPPPPPEPPEPPAPQRRYPEMGQVPIAETPRQAVAEASNLIGATPPKIDGTRVYPSSTRHEVRRIVQTAYPEMQSADLSNMRGRAHRLVSRDELVVDGKPVFGVHPWNGEIVIRDDVMQDAQRGFAAITRGEALAAEEARGVGVVIHESLHEHSPIGARAYVGHAAVLEEVTTELLTRGALRQMGVFSTADVATRGLYQGYIERAVDAVLATVPAARGEGTSALIERVIDAARRMRSGASVTIYATEAAYVEAFAEALGVPPENRARFSEALGEL